MKKLIIYLIISNVIITLLMLPLTASSQKLDSLWSVWNDDNQTDSARLKSIDRILYPSRWQTPISNDSLLILSQSMYDLAVDAELKKWQSIALRYLGSVYSDRYNNYEKALEYFEQRLSLCDEMDDNKGMSETYEEIASTYMSKQQNVRALDYYNKSLEMNKAIHDSINMASNYHQIGIAYYRLSEFKIARFYFENSLEIYENESNDTMIYILRKNIAGTLWMNGEYKDALPIFIECKNQFERMELYNEVASTNFFIGSIYRSQGSFDTAIIILKQNIRIFQEINKNVSIAYVLLEIAGIYMDEANYINTLDYIKQSERIFVEIQHKDGMAMCEYYYGELYLDIANYDKSLSHSQRALTVLEETGNKGRIAGVYALMGDICNKKHDLELSLFYYEKSLSLYEELDMPDGIGEIYIELGRYYKDRGNYSKAQDYLWQSREIMEDLRHEKRIAEVYIDLGDLNFLQGNLSDAIEWSKKGYDIAAEIGVLTLEQEAANCLYKVHKKLGNNIQALNFLERSLELKDSLKTDEAHIQLQRMEFEQQRKADSLAMVAEKLKTDLVHQDSLSQERNSRNIFIVVGLGILLLAVGIFSRMVFVRRTNKELNRRNEIITKEKERAEASEKAKEQFFNNISHEFRTPLTLILGPLDETLEKTSDDKIKPGLQIMQRNALRLQEMINELLDLSKLEFGKVKLLAKEENIVKLTEDYIQSFESLADQRRIKLKFKSDAKEYKAWVDAEKFEKILANLLSNAFKYTNAEGKIRVNISSQLSRVSNISSESSFNKGVYIMVSDSGIGIAKENLPHIFDRFFQVGEASQSHHAGTGTGIGLALAKELVELHHGTINVISEAGKGTTFTVFIPFGHEDFSEEEIVVEVIKEKETEKTEWAVEKEISGNVTEEEVKKKNELPVLLITEDNADMRAYIKTHLEKAYTIIEANDGEAGLQAAIDNIPDLIISDVMMPKMDGYEMTEKLKTDPRTNHIPVIILTARASVDSKIEGLETGADAYVTKPFNARELQVRVKKLIEQREILREHFSQTLESLDSHLVNDPKLPSMDQQFVRKAIDSVKEHMTDEGFNASTFAREMALSRVQLHRKIKALTNKSTTEFIRTLRLSRAASLMKAQTANVTEIAYEVGFSSLSYFTSSFTAQFGSTPSAFIQKYKTRKDN